jgi:hypothetical protein
MKQISKGDIKNSSHLEWRVELSDTILKGTPPGTIYAKLGSIWPSCFRANQKKELILAPMFARQMEPNEEAL